MKQKKMGKKAQQLAKEGKEVEPYIPSNGTEGAFFERDWCCNCGRCPVNPEAINQCRFLLTAYCNEDNGKWYCIDGVPTCLAFISREDFNKKRRGSRTRRAEKNQLKLFD